MSLKGSSSPIDIVISSFTTRLTSRNTTRSCSGPFLFQWHISPQVPEKSEVMIGLESVASIEAAGRPPRGSLPVCAFDYITYRRLGLRDRILCWTTPAVSWADLVSASQMASQVASPAWGIRDQSRWKELIHVS